MTNRLLLVLVLVRLVIQREWNNSWEKRPHSSVALCVVWFSALVTQLISPQVHGFRALVLLTGIPTTIMFLYESRQRGEEDFG